MNDIKIDLGTDQPLYQYIKRAIQDIEVLNILPMYKVDESVVAPFIHVLNWKWNPHPSSNEIQYRRRETGLKVTTKYIGNTRLGILEFDIYCGARDKNKMLETKLIHNMIYVPIADEQGRYLIDSIKYSEYQLVDKLLYPSGKDTYTLKSLLPVVIKYVDATEESINGYIVSSKIGLVKIFSTMEPIISCFMHVSSPLVYLNVHPLLKFCDQVSSYDKDMYEYFQPLEGVDIYVKAYRKGLEEFEYVKSILVMAIAIIREHKPENLEQLNDPKWWIYKLSYYENIVEHRGACHEMHVARMLDTISAQVLPIPVCDKRIMISLLRYVLQTDFSGVDIYSFENKRLRRNEVVSTIVTADVSDKLKRMYKYGALLRMKDMESILKFHPQIILNNMDNKLDGIIHVTDFTNDLDFPQALKYTRNGPNALGRHDKHRIGFGHKQLHPSMIGIVDLLYSPKEVGQSGMISPWADLSVMDETDVNKYPNIKYDLFKFIQHEFGTDVTFNCENVEEFNAILDKLVMATYDLFNIHYTIPPELLEENQK
jgi:hypothetical protein